MEEEFALQAIIMLEILGRPAEYIVESMKKVVEKIGQEKGVRILSKRVYEAKKMEKAENLFTTFAEIELETESIETLFRIIFVYTPSHVEIVRPENLRLKNSHLNLIANEIIRKLHQYDEIAKMLSFERNMLVNKLRQMGIEPQSIMQEMQKSQQGKKEQGQQEQQQKQEKKQKKHEKKSKAKKKEKKAKKKR